MTLNRVVRRLLAPLLDDGEEKDAGTNAIVNARVHYFAPGKFAVGNNAVVGGFLFFNRDGAEISIGRNSRVCEGTVISAVESVVLEDDVLISFNATIMDSDGHSIRLSERRGDLQLHRHGRPNYDRTVTRPVRVCRGAWVGANSMVLKGVTVGVGAIVASGSVVTRDVPDWTVVAGNPARVIRTIPESER